MKRWAGRKGHGTESRKLWDGMPTGRCTSHGKLLFKSKRQAKAAIKSMRAVGEMHAYGCDDVAEHWHVGHSNQRGGSTR